MAVLMSCIVCSGSSNPPVAPAVSLPPEDAHRVTGEEEERSVYTGEELPSQTSARMRHASKLTEEECSCVPVRSPRSAEVCRDPCNCL